MSEKTQTRQINDSELMQALEMFKNGQQEAFEVIYKRTFGYVFSRAQYMLGEEQEALDLSQEVYVALYTQLKDLSSNDSVYAWLKTVTYRKGIKFLNKRSTNFVWSGEEENIFDFIPDEDVKIEETKMEEEDIKTIRSCIEKLPEEQKLVVLAYYYDNLKVEEIAEMFCLSEGTVKSRLYLARKKLKALLTEEEEKQGYKFYAFGAPTLFYAIGMALKTNGNRAEALGESIYGNVCKNLMTEMIATASTVREGTSSGQIIKNAGEVAGKTASKAIGKAAGNVIKKKIIMSLAGIVAAGTVTGTAIYGVKNHLENNKEPEVQQNSSPAEEIIPEEFDKEVFLEEIKDNIICLDSCMEEVFCADVPSPKTEYCALYENEEDSYSDDREHRIVKLVLKENVEYYYEYFRDPAYIDYYLVTNFKTNADVRNYLRQYMADTVVDTYFNNDFLEYGGDLYLCRGGRPYGVKRFDLNSIKYLKEKGGKHYISVEALALGEYDSTDVLEFSKVENEWILTDVNQLKEDEQTIALKKIKRLLLEYQQYERNKFPKEANSMFSRIYHDKDYIAGELDYALVDLEKDGIPEVFIASNGYVVDVFEYKNNSSCIRPMIPWGEEGEPYSYLGHKRFLTFREDNIIRIQEWQGASVIGVDYYQYIAGKLEWFDGIVDTGMGYYRLDTENEKMKDWEEITKREFEAIVEQYPERKDIQWKKISEYTGEIYEEEK